MGDSQHPYQTRLDCLQAAIDVAKLKADSLISQGSHEYPPGGDDVLEVADRFETWVVSGAMPT